MRTDPRIKVKIENGEVVIRLPLDVRPSSTGKTMLLASTNGMLTTEETINSQVPQLRNTNLEGQPMLLNVNVCAYPRR